MSPLFSFCVLQGTVWCAAAIGYFYTNGFFTDPAGLAFSIFFIIGHFFCFAWLLGLICAPLSKIGPRAVGAACITGGWLISFFIAADLIVFAQYRFHIGLSMLEMFFGSAGREIFIFSAGMWMLVLLIAAFIMALEWGLWQAAKRIRFSGRKIITLWVLWALCFGIYNAMYAWGKFKMVPSIVAQPKILPFAYPLSANRRLEKWGFSPRQDPYFLPKTGTLNYPLEPLHCSAPEKQKNVLIIVTDALRADMLNAQVMPQVSSWLKRSGMHVFTNHLSGGNSTVGGIFSLFYGLPHSYWDDFTGQHLPPLVLTRALAQGYTPGIFASSQITSPAFHRNIFAEVKPLRLGSDGSTPWERDQNAVADWEQFLQTRPKNQPFFGFIFLDAPHGYSYPENTQVFTPSKPMNYLLLTNDTDPAPYLNQYKNAVHFDDALIGQVLAGLEKRNLLKDTFIIITGDHGQELNDSHKNFWGHNSNFTDYQTKVPFIVYDASRPAPTRNDYRTSHHDVAPTILQEIYGCTNPPADYALGQNLFDNAKRPFTVFAGQTAKAVRVDDAITVFNEFGTLEQYDNTLRPLQNTPAPGQLKEGLKSFRKFYK